MRRTKQILITLFVLYLLFLGWAILFKLTLTPQLLDHRRAFNLIPFYDNGSTAYALVLWEMRDNVILFLPYGLYLRLLGWRSLKTALLLFLGTSLCFEVLQFTCALGVGDVTDLITNTLGGALGYGAGTLLLRLPWGEERVTKVLTSLAAAATALALGLAIWIQTF